MGCDALTIPHNSNASNGNMFTYGIGSGDTDNQLRYQRLAEMHQHKGASECLSDTFDNGAVANCDFEILPGNSAAADAPGYLRPALERGLGDYAQSRVDALQFGFVGATDTHNASPGNVAEDRWNGHLGDVDDTPQRRVAAQIAGQDNPNPSFNPGGITGVWAEQNTRESIWAALKRRETFATSGPRLVVRMFAFRAAINPCADANFPAGVVAAGGVPMGGALPVAAGAPQLLVYALPDRTGLAEIDIVKASYLNGTVESIHAIPVAASQTGAVCVTWTDPAFNPNAPAFYYARVLERLTWRWSHADCAAVRAQNPLGWRQIAPGCADGTLDKQVQERAWTSPIWYLPQ
jgi:hypothetical protein